MPFQISALPKSQFEHLFSSSDEELASHRAVRKIVDKKPGFPCRVSLADAEIGEEVLLLNYEHQSAGTPFNSNYAIFVRPKGAQAYLRPGEVPEMLRSRTLSLRGFDRSGMLIAADLAEGTALESSVEKMFGKSAVAYIHVHFAKPGCYVVRVDRV